MKVEMQQRHIAPELYAELDYDLFLSLFEFELPVLSNVMLHPKAEEDALSHYAELTRLDSIFTPAQLHTLLAHSASLPAMDDLLTPLEQGKLEQYHLFDLGNFLCNDSTLRTLERPCPIAPEILPTLERLLDILERFTETSFATIRLRDEHKQLQTALAAVAQTLSAEQSRYEQQILEQTGLRMTFPWPKEMELDDDRVLKVRDCALLNLKQDHDIWRIDYTVTQELSELLCRKKALMDHYEAAMLQLLNELNEEAAPFGAAFRSYYRRRVARSWSYVLLAVKEKYNLCLPTFSSNRKFDLKGGYLPGIQSRKKEQCIPLDLPLSSGSTILYGANMSGKTTVLKTVYFLLTIVQLGLPVPAAEITLHYPAQVALLLKSAGDVRTCTSTFGEELAFFSQPMTDGAFILADELFLSTDPANGAILSEILIRSMAARDIVFLCTTHYPEILDIEVSTLYRMADPEPTCMTTGGSGPVSLQQCMPYRIVPINNGEQQIIRTNHTPLQTALLFDLPEDVKVAIKRYLAGTIPS